MVRSLLLSAAVVSVAACGTTYRPTTVRVVQVGEVEASIDRLRGTKVAEVRATGVGAGSDPMLTLTAARLGTTDQAPCTSTRHLGVETASGESASADWPRPLRIRSNEPFDVLLPARLRDFARPGLTMDLAFGPGTSGCVRLPLTAVRDEILWQGSPRWGGSGHLRLEWPTGSAGGIGGGLTAEMRFSWPVRLGGHWRLSAALPFGWVGCRAGCPGLGFHLDENSSLLTGIFYHLGAAALLERVVSVGDWLLLPAVGFRTSLYVLGVFPDDRRDRLAVGVGPIASLGILPWRRRPSPPGFQPAPTMRSGIELMVGALGAYGRVPEGTIWLLSVGWSFVDVDVD